MVPGMAGIVTVEDQATDALINIITGLAATTKAAKVVSITIISLCARYVRIGSSELVK